MSSKKLLLALAALLLAPFVAEGVTRVILLALGRPYDRAKTEARFEAALDALAGDLLADGDAANRERSDRFLHPYFGWDALPYHRRLVRDVEAFRAGLPEDAYTVAVLGGSVAGLFVEKDGASDVLARDLEADPRLAGRRVVVLSHGRGAFKEPQQLFVLSWLFALGVEPDAVINLDGFNELAIANQNTSHDVHPLYPSFPQWSPLLRENFINADPALFDAMTAARFAVRSVAETALARGYSQSAILGRFAVRRLTKAEGRWQAAQKAVLSASRSDEIGKNNLGPPFEGDVEDVLQLAVRCWRDASLDLEALCRRRGIAYLHALQPTLHDRGSKPLTAEEVKNGAAIPEWIAAIERGYPRLREEGAKLAAGGFPFYDASRVFADVEASLYYDPCHFEHEGNVILAHALAAALLEVLPPD